LSALARLSQALGADPAAALAASALIEAEALGLPRFGLDLLDEWAADARPVPCIEGARALVWMDACGCFAPLAVASATLALARAAQELGLAAVFLRGVRGFGRLAPFVRHLADAGLVGVACAEGPPFVAPHGGVRAVIGTNPFAFAAGSGSTRVLIDLASAGATMADVKTARLRGDPLPSGLALNSAGAPTTSAAEVAALLPRGGRIGSLVGLVVELLAGVVGAGRGDPSGRGVFLLALDPAAADGDCPDWRAQLAALQRDWLDAGGHWPRGGAPLPQTVLGGDFAQRLDAHLRRMSAQAAP